VEAVPRELPAYESANSNSNSNRYIKGKQAKLIMILKREYGVYEPMAYRGHLALDTADSCLST
jgi:hypothetical protein